MKLNKSTLAEMPIDKPNYDRDEITIGIVHFGVGGFHRAHQAMYLDRLLETGLARDWGICGVGVLPADQRMTDALRGQDDLYTLVLEHPDGTREPRVIGSIVDFRYAPDDPEAVIELLAAPTTRIISLTITEGGYNTTTAERRRVRTGHRSAGSATANEASPPRRSCPATTSSETATSRAQAFTAYAERATRASAQWMRDAHQISQLDGRPDHTGHHTRRDRRWTTTSASRTRGRCPASRSSSWVLEDDFTDGRPPLEDAGVQLVEDVSPYEVMKLRLLNASHQGLCYFAYLAGYRLVHEAAGDPLFAEFLLSLHGFRGDADPQAGSGIDLTDFKDALLERFANPRVRDTIARLCAESSDRIPKWLLPVIRDNLAAGARCGCPRRSSRAGRGTPRASTSRANRSTSRTRWPTRWCRSPAHNATTRPPSSKTPSVFGDLVDAAAVRRALPVGAGLAASRRCPRNIGSPSLRKETP